MTDNFTLLIEKLTLQAEWCFSSSTDPNLDREKFKGIAKNLIEDFLDEHIRQ